MREFAEAEIRPHVMEWDEAQQFPMDLLPKLADLGLMGIQFAEEYGGAGHVGGRLLHLHRGARARLPGDRAVGRGAQRAVLGAHRACSAPTRRSGSYLPRLVRGEVLGAWGLTEAGAGSDAAGMRTTATRERRRLGAQRRQELHHARRASAA